MSFYYSFSILYSDGFQIPHYKKNLWEQTGPYLSIFLILGAWNILAQKETALISGVATPDLTHRLPSSQEELHGRSPQKGPSYQVRASKLKCNQGNRTGRNCRENLQEAQQAIGCKQK